MGFGSLVSTFSALGATFTGVLHIPKRNTFCFRSSVCLRHHLFGKSWYICLDPRRRNISNAFDFVQQAITCFHLPITFI